MKNSRLAFVALTSAVLLGLSACGATDGDSGGSDATTTVTETSTSEASPTESSSPTSSAGTSGSATTSGSDDGGLAAVREAIEVAEEEAGGTAYEVDDQDEDGSWEIDVAKGSQSIEVDVDGDGKATRDDEDDLDDDDRAGLEAATITVEEAIEAALAEVEGTFDDAELEEEDGTHYWEVTIDSAERDDVDVRVDVTDGKATVEKDDDDNDDD